jgi:DUF2075 family protein
VNHAILLAPYETRRSKPKVRGSGQGNHQNKVRSGCPREPDFEFPEFNFRAKWNLTTDGSLWILKTDSVTEIGCIHTCQGLEVDYVGVILGPDFLIRDGQIVTDAAKRAPSDKSVSGYKKLLAACRT